MIFDTQPLNNDNLYYQYLNYKDNTLQTTQTLQSTDYLEQSNYYDQSSSQIFTNSNNQNNNIEFDQISNCDFNVKYEFDNIQSSSQLSQPYQSYKIEQQDSHIGSTTADERSFQSVGFDKKKNKNDLKAKKDQQNYIKTSSLHNIKTIREYKKSLKQYKKQKYNQLKKCGYSSLQLKQIPDREIFFLIGDIIVEPNFRQEWYSIGESSPYNYYKQLVSNTHFKNRKILQSNYSQSDNGLTDFSNIVHILKNYPDQDTHDYGIILEEYEKRCKEFKQISNIMKQQPDFNIFKEVQNANYNHFTERCHTYIDDIQQKEGEFFFYAICKLNFDKFSFDIQSFGISEAMSQLLGLELSQLSTVIQKKGLISSFSNCTRQMIMKNFIQALSRKNNKSKNEDSDNTTEISETTVIDMTVHTWDGLSVNVEGHFHSVYDKTKDFSLIPFTEIMSMVHVKIDDRVLQTIKSMRFNQQTDIDVMASSEDLYYNLQSQQSSDQEKSSQQSEQELEQIEKKTCKYRLIA